MSWSNEPTAVDLENDEVVTRISYEELMKSLMLNQERSIVWQARCTKLLLLVENISIIYSLIAALVYYTKAYDDLDKISNNIANFLTVILVFISKIRARFELVQSKHINFKSFLVDNQSYGTLNNAQLVKWHDSLGIFFSYLDVVDD